MIGDILMKEPKTVSDCVEIHKILGLKYGIVGNAGEFLFDNARRFVKLNNEVYERLHTCNCCKKIYPGIQLSHYCELCNTSRNYHMEQ